MSSKLNVKSSRKDRPRSSDKMRGRKGKDTPEKGTPSHDALPEEEGMLGGKKVIINDEILALQIKPENLEKLREPRPPSEERKTPPTTSVVVRKLRPATERNNPKPRIVTVAKPAPPDAPLKPLDDLGAAGPRYDPEGKIIPHSILGSVDDYKNQAVQNGDLPPDYLDTYDFDGKHRLTVKYEKKAKTKDYPQFESVEESNALKNWQKRMLERRKQQGYLSKLLNKPADQLVMNQADSYRQTQELRYMLDRTIPTMDYGKGYRIGSEFWKQQERIGDDLAGVHMTLSQTEKGYPPPIEHVRVPNVVLQEKGTDWEKPRTPFHKPWHKTPYLQQRRQQLHSVINELDPHNPDVLSLEVVGSRSNPEYATERDEFGRTDAEVLEQLERQAEEEGEEEEEEEGSLVQDPLRDHPDVHPEPVFGPSLQFAGQPARWTGDSNSFSGQIGIEARVTFETFAGHRTTSYLELANDGTTAIYYDWKRTPKTSPFDIVNAKVQRFYFNTSSGVILPGDTMKFPFVFKSPNAGVFSEQWQLQTHPVVCGGAALVVTLRGVALQEDKFKKQRTELEQELAQKQAEQVVQGVLSDILEGIRTPDRPSSPVDAYITEGEIFTRKNPGMYYHREIVSSMKELFMEFFPPPPEEEEEESGEADKKAAAEEPGDKAGEEGGDGEKKEEEEEEVVEKEPPPPPPEWDLSMATIEEMTMEMDEDDERKQEFLTQINKAVISLSFPPFTPTQQAMYNVGYQLMSEAVDEVVTQALMLKTSLGIPEPEAGIPEEPKTDKKRGSLPKDGRKSTSSSGADSTPSDSKRSLPSAQQKSGKGDSKDKKGGKDGKSQSKTPVKEAKAGKITPGGKRPSTRERDRVTSAGSGQGSPHQPAGDPILVAKYQEKLYTQAYVLVSDMADQMDVVFDEIQHSEGGPRLPVL